MGVVVLVAVPMRMAVVVVVRMVVAMGMTVPMARRIGPAFRFEGGLLGRHDQVHAREHLGQHVVGLDLEVIGLQFDGHVAVAQVVGRAGEVEGRAVLGAVAHDHHRLRCGLHADERAIFGHEHVAAAGHCAARQKDAQRAAGGVGGVEAALLAHVPVEVDGCGALEEHRGEAAAGGDELVDGEHGGNVFDGAGSSS